MSGAKSLDWESSVSEDSEINEDVSEQHEIHVSQGVLEGSGGCVSSTSEVELDSRGGASRLRGSHGGEASLELMM